MWLLYHDYQGIHDLLVTYWIAIVVYAMLLCVSRENFVL